MGCRCVRSSPQGPSGGYWFCWRPLTWWGVGYKWGEWVSLVSLPLLLCCPQLPDAVGRTFKRIIASCQFQQHLMSGLRFKFSVLFTYSSEQTWYRTCTNLSRFVRSLTGENESFCLENLSLANKAGSLRKIENGYCLEVSICLLAFNPSSQVYI